MQDAGIFTMCHMSTQREPSASGLGRCTEPVLDAALLVQSRLKKGKGGTRKGRALPHESAKCAVSKICHCDENSFLVLRFPCLPLMTPISRGSGYRFCMGMFSMSFLMASAYLLAHLYACENTCFVST
ncbi:cyclin-dependent kinase 15 [Platysternon megacephalum]|uniref:Cyclin-dependent kinase 15 n=1 Tax=Platysternon megacephalum TaxID=55544 RepID=A0A4D9EQP7_9SAUR|nr:cyclin-dependent kinase 15 [Platysternon megacephalum]